MRKLSTINEGMFDNGIKRAHTSDVRTEDNVDNLTPPEFVDYINNNYELKPKGVGKPSDYTRQNGHLVITFTVWWIGLTDWAVIKLRYNDDDTTINEDYMSIIQYPKKMFDKNPGLYELFSKDYNVDDRDAEDEMFFWPKEGKMTNTKIRSLIDLIISNVEYPAMVKKS